MRGRHYRHPAGTLPPDAGPGLEAEAGLRVEADGRFAQELEFAIPARPNATQKILLRLTSKLTSVTANMSPFSLHDDATCTARKP